jgi:hypothetical protein
MSYTADPAIRDEFIAALRELASFLAGNPAVPVPEYGTDILLSASSIDDGGQAQVDHAARLLNVPVINDTAQDGHYRAARSFGPIEYRIVAISDAAMAVFHAESSYRGCVTPTVVITGEMAEVRTAPRSGIDLDALANDIRCESCIDCAQQCQTCRKAQEYENRRVSVQRTQEAWWL